MRLTDAKVSRRAVSTWSERRIGGSQRVSGPVSGFAVACAFGMLSQFAYDTFLGVAGHTHPDDDHPIEL